MSSLVVLLPTNKYIEFHLKQNPKGNFGFSLRLTGQQRRWKYYGGNDGNTYERVESTLKNTGKQGRGANKEESGEWLRLNFARKCLKNDIMKKHFPKNEKIHQIETRNEKLFKIKTAHTQQYLLNNQGFGMHFFCSILLNVIVSSEFLYLLIPCKHHITVNKPSLSLSLWWRQTHSDILKGIFRHIYSE